MVVSAAARTQNQHVTGLRQVIRQRRGHIVEVNQLRRFTAVTSNGSHRVTVGEQPKLCWRFATSIET